MPRLVLLPGLGADEALFTPQRAVFPDLEVPAWLAPRTEESLEAFAQRMAAALPRPGSGELILGGVSLGGMVAYEMARQLQPSALLLIASCTSGAAIPVHMRLLARLGAALPTSSLRPPRAIWPLIARAFGATTPQARAIIHHFLETRSPAFVKWGLRALVRWRPESAPSCPIFHLHGSADRLIPSRRVAPTQVVPGAGHLVNLTHAPQVNAFIQAVLEPRPDVSRS